MPNYRHEVYWQTTEAAEPQDALTGDVDCDVAVVGAGFTGMWTAYSLKKARPELSVHLLDAGLAGGAASGTADGFVTPTLGKDLDQLIRIYGAEAAGKASAIVGRSILEIGRFCRREKVDAEYEANDYLMVALNDGQLARLEHDRQLALKLGSDTKIMDAAEARAYVDSPEIKGAVRVGGALVNPYKLARGLARTLRAAGVAIHERTPVQRVEPAATAGAPHTVVTAAGRVRAPQVVLATSASQYTFAGFQRRVLPMWSYVLISEPLTEEQLGRVHWPGREGLVEAKTFLHCGRFTADNRVMWAGGRAYYYPCSPFDRAHMQNPAIYRELTASFARFFPAWRDVRFEFAYGGVIDITRDMMPHFGTLRPGLHYGYGYCGNGIAATHTGGRILRDLVLGEKTDYSTLALVDAPRPTFPPEPISFAGYQVLSRVYEWKDRRG
ncbi:FAD-dependent oxidoreductase [Micromonospora echinospora]|uniref:Glycine/D-amino acid oxidase n=1 Tax=Micromonospora echinospora TaxID=1877 RepID=A0A1C5A7P0_MICEC|nr:FAD-binding oxidoreductase [Micromonospora echinospora]OZV78747.1 FAD-dependent oxidoreductase [Micromonospora echinospora]SCF41091.1 Glycine/D-amino acid oxidase [Micromonospora echinospora]